MRPAVRVGLAFVLLLSLGLGACQRQDGFARALGRAVAPYRWQAARWELAQFGGLLRRKPTLPEGRAAQLALVDEYLALDGAIARQGDVVLTIAAGGRAACLSCEQAALDELLTRRDVLRPQVERILAALVAETLRTEGLYHSVQRDLPAKALWPPVWFVLSQPPSLLILSPRERIESVREILLAPGADTAQKEALERAVEALPADFTPRGLSALVEELGGLGATYPAYVADSGSLKWLLSVILEEWVHQYLAFTPLGARYVLDVLGIARNYEVAQINETLAGMIADELRDRMLASYWPERAPADAAAMVAAPAPPQPVEADAFDYNRFMRETRLAVDQMLTRGEVDAAEQYMEQRRRVLVQEGYAIRRLNQAFFAFHGTYTESPMAVDPSGEGLVDPLGAELRALRAASPSLAAFVTRAARLSGRAELHRLVGE